MATFLERLAGWQPHPQAQHVDWRITPKQTHLLLECHCNACDNRFTWQCTSPDRAAGRVDQWCRWPCNLHR